MKKFTYLLTLISISLCFVQCETNKIRQNGVHNGHEYVDLGLPSGLKWATCNVGAESPEQYGDYFAWGEVVFKGYYDWNTYQHCDGVDSTFTKYCYDSKFGLNGFTDTKTTLDPEDDVATVKWGGNWRMPTADELQELHKYCEWIWTQQNGIFGYKVKGINDNFIFLPAAGSMGGDILYGPNERGWYWSSSLANQSKYDKTNEATHMIFSDSNVIPNTALTRRYGFSIRAVCP